MWTKALSFVLVFYVLFTQWSHIAESTTWLSLDPRHFTPPTGWRAAPKWWVFCRISSCASPGPTCFCTTEAPFASWRMEWDWPTESTCLLIRSEATCLQQNRLLSAILGKGALVLASKNLPNPNWNCTIGSNDSLLENLRRTCPWTDHSRWTISRRVAKVWQPL